MVTKKTKIYFDSDLTNKKKKLLAALSGETALKATTDEISKHETEMLMLMMSHYAIPECENLTFRLIQLCTAMGKEIFPAPKKRGPKTIWNDYNRGILIVEIERLKAAGQVNKQAYSTLAGQKPWRLLIKKSREEGSNPEEVIRQIHSKFSTHPITQEIRKLRLRYESRESMNDWNAFVQEFASPSA